MTLDGLIGYKSYAEQFQSLANKYRDIPIDNVIAAFGRSSATNGMFTANP